MTGTLYVVSTPIGNLGDLTPRAREVLASASTVLCEDTRHTGKLLSHLDIDARTLSYHDHNEAERTPGLIDALASGEDVALVSDAGTPLISDPGFRLVRACRERGIPVRPVPGPSAVTAAVAVSGLPSSSFLFLGFVPSRGAARSRACAEILESRHTVVVFESPSRIGRLLAALAERAPDRPACVLREMTKRYEEHRAGPLAELVTWAESRTFKGEITVVVAPNPGTEAESIVDDEALSEAFASLRSEGLSARDVSKRLAKRSPLTAREIYQRFGR